MPNRKLSSASPDWVRQNAHILADTYNCEVGGYIYSAPIVEKYNLSKEQLDDLLQYLHIEEVGLHTFKVIKLLVKGTPISIIQSQVPEKTESEIRKISHFPNIYGYLKAFYPSLFSKSCKAKSI